MLEYYEILNTFDIPKLMFTNLINKDMKKTNALIVFFLLLPFYMIGQNYQTVSSGRTVYFTNDTGKIKAIAIDSTELETDSVLYPFYNMQQMSDHCFSKNVASWIGSKIIIEPNGMNLYFNKLNDTIKINTLAKLNDSWIAYQATDNLSITATIIEQSLETFLGLQDSVKTIGLQAYDQNNNPIEHSINSKTLKISKNHGFVKTLNFYLFPDYEAPYFDESLVEWDLVGLSNPLVGLQNLTWLGVHDYDLGDEIHVLSNFLSTDITDDYNISKEKKSIYKYTGRADFEDSIRYTYTLNQSENIILNGVSTWEYINEERTVTHKKAPLFDKLPGQVSTSDMLTFDYPMIGSDLKYDIRGYHSFVGDEESDCMNELIADGCLADYQYRRGLGGPYYSCEHAFSLGGDARTLVYYKKGATTWGTPLTISTIEGNEQFKVVEVYPNPANEMLIVELNYPTNGLFIEIFTIHGTLIAKHPLNSTTNNINISDIQTGLYIYKVSNKSSVLTYNKLVIN